MEDSYDRKVMNDRFLAAHIVHMYEMNFDICVNSQMQSCTARRPTSTDRDGTDEEDKDRQVEEEGNNEYDNV